MRDTRYAGDVRGRRTTYLDANSFKSYEGQSTFPLNSKWMVAVRCGPDHVNSGFRTSEPVCMFTMMEQDVVTLAPVSSATEALIVEAYSAFGEQLYIKPASAPLAEHAAAANRMFGSFRVQPHDVLCIDLPVLRGPLTAAQRKVLPKLRDTLCVLHGPALPVLDRPAVHSCSPGPIIMIRWCLR